MSEKLGKLMPVVKVTLIESIKGKQIQVGATSIWDFKEQAAWMEEIQTHITEGEVGTEIMVGLGEMDSDEFHNLPEFTGY